ncbi:uncharacterized protein HaLaN_16412 [Haematococcus lacustris]|uniref:Uncharacterized protein n=1 Tax=Haematococcus lacustris TaxID=44745 RepID=A0A699ZCH9_HAELA|nr:uncharacterized protein HaLaN_16412 [Haematococcus lacustris]
MEPHSPTPLNSSAVGMSSHSSSRSAQLILADLQKSYEYQGADTCAADGMCQEKCPVKINTGDLIKHIRAEQMDMAPRSSATAKRMQAAASLALGLSGREKMTMSWMSLPRLQYPTAPRPPYSTVITLVHTCHTPMCKQE